MKKLVLNALALSFVTFVSAGVALADVKIEDNQLWIDGQAQPQLFGAELQYFRLRGGQGRNIPRAKVIDLWNRALDRMVEAKMNVISFYIPWDFHEYAEGKFDFTGTVDEDGDGNPDYPSRDLITFFKLVEQHGIKHILVRPGPYVNAEWGFLGFGAIPLWFHEKYPDSHMRNPQGLRTKLYDYHNPDLLRKTQSWFKALHEQVLNRFIGPGKPITFIQIDNETNFMWQSLYNHDYGAPAINRYRSYLQSAYGTIDRVNALHNRNWSQFSDVLPPVHLGDNLREDQDWYRFQDESIHSYLHLIRRIWENLGVREPDILFTLAESYNVGRGGILPNYRFRNDPGVTGMMTVNLYPKLENDPLGAILNTPFKSDHDVKAADSAKEYYLGHASEWAMGPEIQGGWWRGIDVSDEARKQTYLSVLGHGLKALFVYYFTDGDNWQNGWAHDQIAPYFNALRQIAPYQSFADKDLPQGFWQELQTVVDRNLMVGFDARAEMLTDRSVSDRLYFDSPLDHNARPSRHYAGLKEIGEKLIEPEKEFLGRATEMVDPVCLLKDVGSHVPTDILGLDAGVMNADWASGLIGNLLQTAANPRILHWGLNPLSQLEKCKLILVQDSGSENAPMFAELKRLIQNGHTVVSLIGNQLSRDLGLNLPARIMNSKGPVLAYFQGKTFTVRGAPLFHYELAAESACKPLVHVGGASATAQQVAGYHCEGPKLGRGTFVQMGAVAHDVFNSAQYESLTDVPERTALLSAILQQAGVQPQIQIRGGGDRLVAFGRIGTATATGGAVTPELQERLITIKNSQNQARSFDVLVHGLSLVKVYRIVNLFSGEISMQNGASLAQLGFSGKLPRYGSTVYKVTVAP